MRGSAADPEQGRLPGTLSFATVHWDHERSADILISPMWTDEENEFGYRGTVRSPGIAGHGSASPWDIRATFVAAGPAIKRGVVSDIPTGNIDLTPTALRLVGADVPAGLDGRVLEEALVGGPQPASLAGEGNAIQTSAEVGDVLYEVTAYRSGIGTSVYFDGTDVVRTRTQSQRGATASQAGTVVVTREDIGDGFYSDEVPFSSTGSWLGLYVNGEQAELREAAIDWTTTREDDYVEHQLDVSPVGPELLFGDVARLSPGSAVSISQYTVSLLWDDPELALDVAGVRWVVRLTSTDELGCDGRVALSDGSRSQVLYDVRQDDAWACDEPRFEINWAGDLDRDGRPDFVATFSPKYSVYPRRLYLSSASASGALVGQVALYERTAM